MQKAEPILLQRWNTANKHPGNLAKPSKTQ